MARVLLNPLAGTPEDVRAIQHVLDRAPGYAYRVTGEPPTPTEGDELLSALPPNVGPGAKHVYGVVAGGRMIGCLDVIRVWPDRGSAHIGLLVLADDHAGQGLGRATFRAVEDLVQQWPEIDRLRAAVVATNDVVLPFWRAMGLVETGETKPYQRGSVNSHAIVLTKRLQATSAPAAG